MSFRFSSNFTGKSVLVLDSLTTQLWQIALKPTNQFVKAPDGFLFSILDG